MYKWAVFMFQWAKPRGLHAFGGVCICICPQLILHTTRQMSLILHIIVHIHDYMLISIDCGDY